MGEKGRGQQRDARLDAEHCRRPDEGAGTGNRERREAKEIIGERRRVCDVIDAMAERLPRSNRLQERLASDRSSLPPMGIPTAEHRWRPPSLGEWCAYRTRYFAISF